MAKQQAVDELNLRRKARRRLIGAIALTLVVVAILPMILDTEPKPGGQDIDLRIPAPDKAGEFAPNVAASEGDKALPLAAPVAGAAAPLAASAVAMPGKEEPAAVASPKMEVPVMAQPAADVQPELKATEPVAAESRREDKPAGTESYVAQIGAFSSADTAKNEAAKLKKLGFKAYTEKIGDKTRVRVGPYAEREKAEKVRQMLEKHGLHPVVISEK